MTADPFEAARPKLFAIAYRMMGNAAEAEDIVQDAYLRWHTADRTAVQSPGAYLRRTVIRLCLDAQKSARARREQYPGVWLPEPVREGWPDAPPASPEERVTEWESLSVAFLLLLEQLTPEERAVFLLREVFGYGYEELSEALGKSEAACRQMFSRARKHITDHRPRFTPTPDQHLRVFSAFMQAVSSGSLDALVALLAEDAVAVSDGGGKSPAFVRPITGRDAVVKLLLGLMHRVVKTPGIAVEVVALNGQPGVLIRSAELGDTAMLPHIVDGAVQAVYFVRNPDKLSRLIT